MLYFHSWSGGKDSTASVILDHIHGLPPSKIIFSEVMFDKKRGISGELPEHIDFVKNRAIPLFEKWGYECEIVHAEKDYLDIFYHIKTRSKTPERNGKHYGFLIGGACEANRTLKTNPIHAFYKNLNVSGEEFTEYIGIAIEETDRLKRLEGTNKVSLLARYGYTERMCFELCEEYGLLSPTYSISNRGGCWFCPNQSFKSLARLKTDHPELWEELRTLSREKNIVSQAFKYNKTFPETEEIVDREIEKIKYTGDQLRIPGF